MIQDVEIAQRTEWITKPIGEVLDVVTGNTPSKREAANTGDYMPFVKPPELQNELIGEAMESLSELGAKAARVVPAGSVLISCIGNLGRVGLTDRSIAFNQQINAVKPHPEFEPKYLFYYFQGPLFRNALEGASTATTVALVNKGNFIKLPLTYPPLPEQRRIVEAIELQLGRLDAAVARLHAAKAKLKRYKQAVLKAAVEEAGEDPNAETVVLADVADLCLGKMLDRQKNKGTPHPYLRNINVRWGAFETEDLHQMPFGDREHERYGLEVGDLVMCEGGEPGRCAVWDGSIPDMKIQKALHRIRCNTSTDPHFVMFNVLSAAWLGTIDKYYTGTTIKHLTGKMLARFELVLPPIKVQRRLVMRIQEAFERTDEMESTLDAQLAHSTRLRQSVLKRAFEGRLIH